MSSADEMIDTTAAQRADDSLCQPLAIRANCSWAVCRWRCVLIVQGSSFELVSAWWLLGLETELCDVANVMTAVGTLRAIDPDVRLVVATLPIAAMRTARDPLGGRGGIRCPMRWSGPARPHELVRLKAEHVFGTREKSGTGRRSPPGRRSA